MLTLFPARRSLRRAGLAARGNCSVFVSRVLIAVNRWSAVRYAFTGAGPATELSGKHKKLWVFVPPFARVRRRGIVERLCFPR